MEKPMIVVVDEGSSQIKTVWRDSNGKLQKQIVKARCTDERTETMDGGVSDDVYEVDGVEITVGDNILKPINTNSDFYQTSDINRVLVHHALRMAGFGGQKVDLMVTLPLDAFFSSKARQQEKIDHIKKPVTHVNGEPLAIINKVRVAPEAVPVLDSFCLDDNGEFMEEFDGIERVMIVDIGGTTTDISIVTGDNMVEKRCSVKMGVFDIANELKRVLLADTELNITREPSVVALDNMLHTGTYQKKTAIQQQILQACKPTTARILAEMTRLHDNVDDISFVTYVGGGANLLAKTLQKQYGGNTITHKDPEFAVADGLLKNQLSQQLEQEGV